MRLALVIIVAGFFEFSSQGQGTRASKLVEIGTQPGGYSVKVTNQSNGWVYTGKALWRTTDGGTEWTSVPFPRPQSPKKEGAPPTSLILVNFDSADSGWISVENSKQFPTVVQQRSVFRTNDGGRTWLEQPSPPLVERGTQYSQFYLSGGSVGWEGGVEPVASAAGNPPKCKPWWDGRRTQPAIFHTYDSGKSWVEQNLPGSHGCRVDELFFRNAREGIAVAEHDVYYTEDSGTKWHQSDFLVCCTDSDWHSVFSMPPASVFFIGATGWLSYQDGYLFKTSDGGKSWRQLAHPGQIWHWQPGPGNFGILFFTTEQHGWILGGDHAVYETVDGGATWLRLRNATPISSISCSDRLCWALSEKELYRIEAK